MASDNDWPEMMGNLCKAQNKLSRLSRILGREGANARVSGTFFKSVVPVVLLFGSETWVLNSHIVRTLEGFHHKVAC